MKMRTPRLLTRWALITASIAALFFLSAGTLRIASLRNYLVALSFLLLVTMLAVDPGLAQERAKSKDAGTDESRFATGLLFLLTLAIAGFSVGHCHQAFNTPPPIRHLALAAFLLSGAFQTWAMIANPFFSPVVRIQTERGHHLILTGPYQLMRHPGYFAMSISVPASALAIGSWIALMPAAGFVLLIKHRARLEDEFLRNNLPGYIAYATRVGGPYAR
jgi:protein-S-isoprenylcysteine O-methyltransferase Ste14